MGSELDHYTDSHSGKEKYLYTTARGMSGTTWHVVKKTCTRIRWAVTDNY